MTMLRAILNGFMGDESSNTDCEDFTLFSCFLNAKRAFANRTMCLIRFEGNGGRFIKESVW
jgi:hypothetical protein